MRRPCETTEMVQKENGGWRSTKFYSYVAVLTQVDGDQVMAVRFDDYERKSDVSQAIRQEHEYEGWNIKLINKLYDDDFRAGNHQA